MAKQTIFSLKSLCFYLKEQPWNFRLLQNLANTLQMFPLYKHEASEACKALCNTALQCEHENHTSRSYHSLLTQARQEIAINLSTVLQAALVIFLQISPPPLTNVSSLHFLCPSERLQLIHCIIFSNELLQTPQA